MDCAVPRIRRVARIRSFHPVTRFLFFTAATFVSRSSSLALSRAVLSSTSSRPATGSQCSHCRAGSRPDHARRGLPASISEVEVADVAREITRHAESDSSNTDTTIDFLFAIDLEAEFASAPGPTVSGCALIVSVRSVGMTTVRAGRVNPFADSTPARSPRNHGEGSAGAQRTIPFARRSVTSSASRRWNRGRRQEFRVGERVERCRETTARGQFSRIELQHNTRQPSVTSPQRPFRLQHGAIGGRVTASSLCAPDRFSSTSALPFTTGTR